MKTIPRPRDRERAGWPRLYSSTLAVLAITGTLALFPMQSIQAHGPTPPSLKGIPIPPTPGLTDGDSPIVVNKELATVLGKAFFWDENMGSDGNTCATCHHHAGVDGRVTNQMGQGFLSKNPTGSTFEKTASGRDGGPNYTFHASDFPFHQVADPLNRDSAVTFHTDDTASSAGVFPGVFKSVSTSGRTPDDCDRAPQAPWTVDGVGTRQTTNRNAHSIINAAFLHRSERNLFANHVFNGRNPEGDRDPDSFVWVATSPTTVDKEHLSLQNAVMASVGAGPPTSPRELSCAGRTFPDVGRRLLSRRPLEFQKVHRQDSVLGEYRHSSGKGLNQTYQQLIEQVFASRYWSANPPGEAFGKPVVGSAYNMTEANFSLFYSVAVKFYLDTLVSDRTPFDGPRTRVADQYGYFYPKEFNEQQRRGLKIFLDAHCINCHSGPILSDAAHPDVMLPPNLKSPSDQHYADQTFLSVVDRRLLNKGRGLLDKAATNTGVTPTDEDPGANTTDDFGNPISFTDQYIQLLLGNTDKVKDPFGVTPCNFANPNALFFNDFLPSELASTDSTDCNPNRLDFAQQPKTAVAQAEFDKEDHGRLRTGIDGSFLIPTLRNVELTGPFMHNGGMATLEQVVEFYRRGGNFANPETPRDSIFNQAEFITSDQDAADLVAFLKALTDERVRWEKAPFDHPSLRLPNGHDLSQVDAGGLAKDEYITLPAVGKHGRTKKQGPLKSFIDRVEP